MTIDDVLLKLESLHAASTGGEWSKTSSLPTYAVASGKIDVVTATGREYRQNYSGKHGCRESDAEFIATAHNLLPQVLTEIRRQQQENSNLIETVGQDTDRIKKLSNENAALKQRLELGKRISREHIEQIARLETMLEKCQTCLNGTAESEVLWSEVTAALGESK